MNKTFIFKHCRVHVSPGYTETVFDDGTKVPAAPEPTQEYLDKARRYGYGDDAAALSREHEILHTFLAEKLGFGSSPTMWALAHAGDPDVAPIWEQQYEEELVLAFQTYLNGKEWAPALNRLAQAGYDLADLVCEAKKLLRSP